VGTDAPSASLLHFDAAEARLRFETDDQVDSESGDEDIVLDDVQVAVEDADAHSGSVEAHSAMEAAKQVSGEDQARARSVTGGVLEPVPEEADVEADVEVLDFPTCNPGSLDLVIEESWELVQANVEPVAMDSARAGAEVSMSQSACCKAFTQEEAGAVNATLVNELPEAFDVRCASLHLQSDVDMTLSASDAAHAQVTGDEQHTKAEGANAPSLAHVNVQLCGVSVAVPSLVLLIMLL
jgi:hypothetical protein